MTLPSNKLRLTLLALLMLAVLSLYVFLTQKTKPQPIPPTKPEKKQSATTSPTNVALSEVSLSESAPSPIKQLPPLEPKTHPKQSLTFPPNPRFATYGSETQSAQDDLATIDKTLQVFWTFLKTPDALSVRSNFSITKSLTGHNPEGIAFIPKSLAHINEKGELTDRWKTPLHFHPESLTHIDIRSAGPDQDFFTEDDLIVSSKRNGPRS